MNEKWEILIFKCSMSNTKNVEKNLNLCGIERSVLRFQNKFSIQVLFNFQGDSL